jgi:DNA ligase-1
MKIYKKDSKSKIRVLEVTTEASTLVQTYGLLGGKLTTSVRQCKAKNVGRSNATTGEEQASIQAKALVVKKLKEGYYTTIEEAEASINVMPMLATDINLSTLTYPVYIQPKLDGIRMVATSTTKLSRRNRPIDTVSHIDTTFLGDSMLDGELYSHSMSFQQVTSAVKKYRPNITNKIKYYVYDLPSLAGTFMERYKALSELVKYKDNIVLVDTVLVANEKELKGMHQWYLAKGFEGSIIRTNNSNYEFNKRSKALMKYKDFIDIACEVIDVTPNDADPTQGTIWCTHNGEDFKCNMKVNMEERRNILANRLDYIGKTAEVRFFEYTDDGVPRFPVYHGIRIDK